MEKILKTFSIFLPSLRKKIKKNCGRGEKINEIRSFRNIFPFLPSAGGKTRGGGNKNAEQFDFGAAPDSDPDLRNGQT